MYASASTANRRWNMAMSAIAGVCGVVAVTSFAALLAPSNMHTAPAVRTVSSINAAPFVAAQSNVVPQAYSAPQAAPAADVYQTQAAGSNWVPIAGLLAIPAAVLAFMLTSTPAYADASVKAGSDSGELVFVPKSVTIKAGEKVSWVNNAGFPHNIVFDEDEIPDGANAAALSHEDYLNAKGDTVSSTFDKPGTYAYYCEPHQGAGMAGTVIVN
jgi:plastocyanin